MDSESARQIQQAKAWASEAVRPFVAQIMRIRCLERPTYHLTSEGLTLISDGLSAHQHDMIRQCEDAIADIHLRAAEMARSSVGQVGGV